MKLTEAQRKVLEALKTNCVEAFQNGDTGWRWFIKLPNGMVVKIAGNDTVYTLLTRGLLRQVPGISSDRRVSLTPAGRSALQDGDALANPPHREER